MMVKLSYEEEKCSHKFVCACRVDFLFILKTYICMQLGHGVKRIVCLVAI